MKNPAAKHVESAGCISYLKHSTSSTLSRRAELAADVRLVAVDGRFDCSYDAQDIRRVVVDVSNLRDPAR